MIFQANQLPPNAFYLFSYPRSGSNWLISALAYLLNGVKAEARIGPELYPYTYGEVGAESFWIQSALEWSGDRPLLIKSHESVEAVTAIYPKGRKIYLLRDGRDVLVSFYFYHQAFIDNPQNKRVFSTGRLGQDLGAISRNNVRFEPAEFAEFVKLHGPEWVRHVRSWMSEADLTLRYESLKTDFEGELRRIIDALSLRTARSVSEARQEYVEQTRNLLVGDNRAFHRKGITGDWRTYCDDAIRQVLKAELGETLVALGYESGLEW